MHREDGPAFVYRFADGTAAGRYYRDGKRHSEDEVAGGLPRVGKSMTGGRTSHITVTYRDGDAEITSIYAISEERLGELGRQAKHPTGKDLWARLETKGCRLDSSDGPAVVWRTGDGTAIEEYYRNGRLHRESGPAIIGRHADGSAEEYYYRDGKPHREDGPALVWRFASGATVERYYRDGKLYREDGSA